jgi:hypothetical protein
VLPESVDWSKKVALLWLASAAGITEGHNDCVEAGDAVTAHDIRWHCAIANAGAAVRGSAAVAQQLLLAVARDV